MSEAALPDCFSEASERERALALEASGRPSKKKQQALVSDANAEIARLAALDPIAYDQAREDAAKRLKCRVATLDAEVARRRNDSAAKKAVEICADTEPCSGPVVVGELLDDVRKTIRRFIVCEPETATAAALWVAFTWIADHASVSPLAIVTAPEKGCGKTQLLELIGRLSRRPLFASNITPAATFRVIEAKSPTLLIDEADAFFRENEELRGIINSGHTRTTAYVVRTVGDNFEVRQFSTWSAKCIAGIGRLPETVMSRAIVLSLRRKLKSEAVERLRNAEPEFFEALAAKLARFGVDHGPSIGLARPHLPDALGDRQQDNWEPLLGIADLAGGRWPKEARRAALALSGTEREAVSTSEELLADIRSVFDASDLTKISMAELLRRLVEDEAAPWGAWNKGRAMTGRQLGARLKDFGIQAVTISLGSFDKPKGFRREQFEDAWRRYLDGGHMPSTETSTPPVARPPINKSARFKVTNEVTEGIAADHRSKRSPASVEIEVEL